MSILDLDRETFLENFPQRHFSVRHTLAGHPLLSLERLIQAAEQHPAQLSEHYSGQAAVSQHPASHPRNGLSLVETIRTIETNQSWAVIKHPEVDPSYRKLLEDVVAEIRPLAERRQKGIRQLEAYIFVTSPGSVTPLHMDDEHNFLLQIQGKKTFHAWPLDNQDIVTPAVLERYYDGGHRNLYAPPDRWTSELSFDLSPGDGLYSPVHSPHWVQNGDEVSISLSITFRTRKTIRDARVHLVNAKLRRKGFHPTACGESAIGDMWKSWAARLAQRRIGRPNHY